MINSGNLKQVPDIYKIQFFNIKKIELKILKIVKHIIISRVKYV
jgi:hypothetical protein